MTIRHEIKSQLARLLATEDLVVEHKKVETAQFNVQTRVLTLPLWDKASENVIDMLVSHEVGHALYTPDEEWWEEYEIHPSFVNIVEDARIEKLMKRRYDGISKTFYKGYTELHNDDFFQVKKKNISEMMLADRVNLHYKIGTYYDIPFNSDEMFFINKIDLCETFEDALKAAKALYDYCLSEEKRKEEETFTHEAEDFSNFELDEDGEGMEMPMSQSDESDKDADDDGETQEETEIEIKVDNHVGGHTGVEEISAETVESLEESLKNLTNEGSRENVYLELPNLDIDKVIISNKKIHELCAEKMVDVAEQLKKETERFNSYDPMFRGSLYDSSLDKFLKDTEEDYNKFKKSAQKEVNYLVKEFECKKSAGAYARATTSRTGVLDTTKLINYKFSEDLFKKVTVLPDGKNHGLVFILDWSGSMNNVLVDTLKQLYNLIWFCRKVQIPYDVYAFTSDYPRPAMHANGETFYEPKDMMAEVGNQFALLNMFSSQTRSKDLDTQMINIWRSACIFAWNISTPYLDVPYGYRLSGTPLNEAMVSLHTLLPDFQKRTGAEKVQCVVLTDGESQPLRYHREVQRQWEDEPYMGTNYFGENCVLRDRKLGKTYISKDSGRYEATDMLLENLKDSFPQTNFIGIRILPSREGGSFIRRYCGYETPESIKMMHRWKKERSFAITTSGYHTYFGMASSALNNDGEFTVKEDATKAEIKRAFAKSLKGKKMNKKILSEFIELVA